MPNREGGNPQESQGHERAKEQVWLEKLTEIRKVTDALKHPIDAQIQETVVGLNLLGLPTSGSCEGHIDRARGAPWVRIESPDRPQERFNGEEEIIGAIARKYQISPEDIRRDVHHEAHEEAMNVAAQNWETEAFIAWRSENDKLRIRVAEILENFYKGRVAEPNSRIELSDSAEGWILLRNGGADFQRNTANLNNDERRVLGEHLRKYQDEMRTFTAFLRERYFAL